MYDYKIIKIVGNIEDDKLDWVSLFEEQGNQQEKIEIFADETKLKDWITSILGKWLKDENPAELEWLPQTTSQKENGRFLLRILKEIAEITVDSSYERNPHVFNWNESRLDDQCKSVSLLKKEEAEEIIKKQGLEIPTDAELADLRIDGENTSNPHLIARYVHIIPDKEFSEKNQTNISPEKLELYQNCGKIIVEDDFCVFFIDPEHQTVFSEASKWHSVV